MSIDDGTRHDLRTAELLASRGLRATFYIPAASPRDLTPAELRTLDETFEVGSHTYGHVDLTTLSESDARREIRDGKRWLEDILGHRVRAFAYPFGRFTEPVAELVAQEGFDCARTCLVNRHDHGTDRYHAPMTADARDASSRRGQIRYGLHERNFLGIRNYLTTYRLERDWEKLFARALDHVGAHGGVAHLVIHSADIDDNHDWDRLGRVLDAAADAPLTPLTNTEAYAGRT